MKFDICLINPPFSSNLSYRFLEKSISISNKVISIQPVMWLFDPLAKFHNRSKQVLYEETISKHIKDLELVPIKEVKEKFNIIYLNDLGIYTCDKDGGYDYKKLSSNEMLNDIIDYIKNNQCVLDYNKNDGFRLRITQISFNRSGGSGERGPLLSKIPIKDIVFKDGKNNGKWWYDYYGKNQFSKIQEEIPISIKFDNEEEAHNFYKSLQTDFSRYYVNSVYLSKAINEMMIPWMGNAKNPRTGKIGYKSEWMNEDFYKFFEIKEEYQKIIEQFISDYEDERKQWLNCRKI